MVLVNSIYVNRKHWSWFILKCFFFFFWKCKCNVFIIFYSLRKVIVLAIKKFFFFYQSFGNHLGKYNVCQCSFIIGNEYTILVLICFYLLTSWHISLPNKILDQSNLKDFADNKMWLMWRILFWEEKFHHWCCLLDLL